MRAMTPGRANRVLAAAVALCTLLAISLQPANAAGGVTGDLRGTVVDTSNGAPIANATIAVVAPSGRAQTSTDQHGFFSFVQLPADTYTVSIEHNGFTTAVIAGVTVLGDQTQSVGTVKLAATLKSIGSTRTTSRATSAFQPNQTVDVTTFSGARVDQALGEKGSTDYNKLVESAPGVIKTIDGSQNAFSIRGSASVEIGFQFDGLDLRGSFFDENVNQGFLNGIGAGRGSVQVVSGAGDATQGGIGAGVVNIVPGRGSYPGDGFVSADIGSPFFNHSFAFQYGTGTKDGRLSEFFSVRSRRQAPEIAPYGRDASDAGQYFNTGLTYDDDVLNNLYYKFGKNNEQQIQVLADFINHRQFGNYGGLNGVAYYPYSFYEYQQFNNSKFGCLIDPADPTATCNPQAWYRTVIPYYAGVPRSASVFDGGIPVTSAEQFDYGPNDIFKLGYSRPLGHNTSLNAFFYNLGGLNNTSIVGDSQDLTKYGPYIGFDNSGGRRVGFQTQITAQAGEKHILTFVGKFENGHPYWNQQSFSNTFVALDGTMNTQVSPNFSDWYLPQTLGAPVSASNPCLGPQASGGYGPLPFDGTQPLNNQPCYLYSYMLANGLWHGHLPQVPSTGFNYGSTDFQQYGIGFRDQWSPNSRLRVDYGLRLDGQNLKWGANPFTTDLSNTADVGLGFAQLRDSYLHPKILEPRFAADYILGPNDNVRASYGRSVSFFFGQTAGTPTGMTDVDPVLYQIPAKDNPLVGGSAALGPACGSGWHGPGVNRNGTYVQNPNVFFSGSGTLNQPGWYFPCPNFAASVYWNFDQGFAAPDIGGQQPATYNNWDLAYGHQFKNGWGSKLTGYVRRGFDTYQTTVLAGGPPDPVTGAFTNGAFQERETGTQKAVGLEFQLTTPDRPYGWSGFFSANYLNELTNTPPVPGSDSLPAVSQYLYLTGLYWHQSYLPPLSATTGVQYKTKSGIKINPIFNFDNGVPFGVGQTTAGYINGQLFSTIPTSNLGIATPYAGQGSPNNPVNATCYADPAYAGSYFHPRNFACRGYSEPALAGQAFTRPRLYSDLNLEYEHKRVTYGVYISNLFDNYRAEPTINQVWQPLATGRGGAQTGQFPTTYPINQDGSVNQFYNVGFRNASVFDEFWLPYQRLYTAGRVFRFYVQLKL